MGYVYLIGTPTFGWYKIGKSKTPEVRVRDIGVLLPFKLEVISVWRAENHSAMESALHQMYRDFRINGEWFQFSKKQVTAVVDAIPELARVYPSNVDDHPMAKFRNIEMDKCNGRKVLGLRVQKQRGDLTDEEREQRKQASIAKKLERKRLRALETQQQA